MWKIPCLTEFLNENGNVNRTMCIHHNIQVCLCNHYYSGTAINITNVSVFEVLLKMSENLNIPHKPLALRTCAARCLSLYLSTVSQPTGVFISEHVSEFWLFPLQHFHVCLLISKWQILRSKEFALNIASSSTKLQLKPTKC